MSNEIIPLELPFGLLVSGSTGSGKTYFTRHVVEHLLRNREIAPQNLFIFSPSWRLSGDWDFIANRYPDAHIYDKFKAKIIDEIKESQDKIAKDKRLGREYMPDVLVILDDLGSSRVFTNPGGALAQLAAQGRHHRISYAVLVQNLTMLSVTIRVNASYIAFFRVNNLSEVDRFVEEYGLKKQRGSFYLMFEDLFKKPYQFLLADKRNHRYYINGRVPWEPRALNPRQ